MSLAESTINGYHPPLRLDRSAQGGGVAVWIKENLAYEQLSTIDCGDHEIIWLTVNLQGRKKLVLGGLYRPGSAPGHDISILEHLDTSLDHVRFFGTNVMLAGDFNVRNGPWLGSSKTTGAGEYLEEICAVHGLVQHVKTATRGNNPLDLILSDLGDRVSVDVTSPIGRSDHSVLLTKVATCPQSEKRTTRRVWRYSKADWGRLGKFYRDVEWSKIISSDPNLACKGVTETILDGMHRHLPNKRLTTRPSDPSWWTPECTAAVQAKRRSWDRLHTYPSKENEDLYKTHCARCVACLHNAKDRGLAAVRQRLKSGSLQDKQWWSTLNPLSATWRIYPSSKWSSQWPYDGYIRHGWMTSCGRGRDLATLECFGRGSRGTIFVRSSKLSLFFPEVCPFGRVFLFPAHLKDLAPNVQALGLLVSTMFWGSLWKLRSVTGHFFANSYYDHKYFLKSSFLFSKAEPVLLAWQLWRSQVWAKHFGDGTLKTRMKTRLPGVGEIERRRTIDRRRDWYSHVRWSMVQKRKKSARKSACDCAKAQPFIIYKSASFEEPVSETRRRYRFALRCFGGRGCTAAGRSGCSAGTAKKSSHPWHFRCWSLRRNELECTDLVHWTEALHRSSSRDAIIVVGSVLEKHLDGDFTPDQEKKITFKRWPPGYQSWKLGLALNGLKLLVVMGVNAPFQ